MMQAYICLEYVIPSIFDDIFPKLHRKYFHDKEGAFTRKVKQVEQYLSLYQSYGHKNVQMYWNTLQSFKTTLESI